MRADPALLGPPNRDRKRKLTPQGESTVRWLFSRPDLPENLLLHIEDHMRERIFEAFYRIKENTKQKGTGIGLTLARSLTLLHQGHLFVKESGEGLNTFVLCLPLQPPVKKK